MKKVIISGYFNPLHVGHLDLIKMSQDLGDYLIVVVNNDEQVKLKGSVPFMSQEDRIRIVKAIKGVDEVFLSVDNDLSVCKSIEVIHTKTPVDIFANGGDRHNVEVPEGVVCKRLGIEMVDGIGKKIRKSSDFFKE